MWNLWKRRTRWPLVLGVLAGVASAVDASGADAAGVEARAPRAPAARQSSRGLAVTTLHDAHHRSEERSAWGLRLRGPLQGSPLGGGIAPSSEEALHDLMLHSSLRTDAPSTQAGGPAAAWRERAMFGPDRVWAPETWPM